MPGCTIGAVQFQRLNASHAAATRAVAERSIRQTEGTLYSATQVEAWLHGMSEKRFRQRLSETWAIGTFDGADLTGFATFVEATSELDLLYVDPDLWRRGLGRRLVRRIKDHARFFEASEIRVDASLLARPLLESQGYTVW